ncbi:MAG: ATP-grasp domain-containing protein [Promethearchaeota archaeon]
MRLISVGFNSRPIAELCLELGMKPIIIDNFGDLDTRGLDCESYFYLDYMKEVGDNVNLDFKSWARSVLDLIVSDDDDTLIIIGSGFDDDLESLKHFHSCGTVLSSALESIVKARDLEFLRRAMDSLGIQIKTPRSRFLSFVDLRDRFSGVEDQVFGDFSFPFLIKEPGHGGGMGITFIRSRQDFNDFRRRILKEKSEEKDSRNALFCVQEYLSGPEKMDMSVIVVNDRIACFTEQLIGSGIVNAPRKFSYCGNIVPFRGILDRKIDEYVRRLVRFLHGQVGLSGIYGIDFVLMKKQLYLVEINTRIPGSLEPACFSLGKNLLIDHLYSFNTKQYLNGLGVPIKPSEFPLEPKFQVFKLILFAPWDFQMPNISKLDIIGFIKDISPPKTIINKGQPILTYFFKGELKNIKKNEITVVNDVKKIFSYLNFPSVNGCGSI